MHLENMMLNEMSQSQKDNTAWSHLPVSQIVKLIEAESGMVVAGAGGGGIGKSL